MGTAVNVRVFSGGRTSGVHQFDSDKHRTIRIGRLSSAQLKLDDPQAAKIHAVIDFSGGGVSLIDMGSSNGTLVNGAKVRRVALNDGDQVVIGKTQLLIGFGKISPAAAENVVTLPARDLETRNGRDDPGGAPTARTMPNAAAARAGAMSSARADRATMPRFDVTQTAPIARITQDRLRSAAVESRPHPSLPPEDAVGPDTRAMEMRVYWGQILLSVDHFEKPKAITIGESKGTNFFISSEGLPIERFPLIRYVNDEYVLTFAPGMEGEVEVDGELHLLDQLRASSLVNNDDDLRGCYQVVMPADTRALIHWGGATFALRFVAPPKPIPTEFLKNLDLQYLNILLLSIFAHVALVVTFLVQPTGTDALRDDLFDERGRFVDLILNEPEETPRKKRILDQLKQKIEPPTPEEKPKTKAKEVKVADRDANVRRSNRPAAVTQAEKAAKVSQQFSKLFAGSNGGDGSLLGGGGGGSLSGNLSNVIGTTGAKGKGALAGLGIRGGVATGGGIGTSRGVAGIGTSGRLGGGSGGYGGSVGKLGKRQDRGITSLATPIVLGSLPKEVIKKVIDQNRAQIRYCYEVELQKNQDLAGKVQLKWVIGATGSVVQTQVATNSMQTPAVGRCLRQKIMGWKFPAPAGGGIVEVNYPFVFKSN